MKPRALPDLVLASVVVAIVATMIVPLPTFVLDLLLSLNLSASIVLLVVALYVPEALAIGSFPTILLLTTLFRLALEVAAARLILGHGDAGAVIRAFGSFVVHGNYVVGAVVFCIITLVQYLVIARGGERVAEVAARFTLDALPGKQLAIDAEVRAGAIDAAEARRRRAQLSRESSFYGAMDGALKFVKGDAIAGIVIAVVNIVGGIAIGVGQRGMGIADAVQRYGLLTIGQGLVAQVAAVVISAAAAILVTRVASEETGGSLGSDIAEQVVRQPRALGVAAVLMAGMAVVPGMPAVPFLALAALTALGAQAAQRGKVRAAATGVVPIASTRVEPLRVEADVGMTQAIETVIDRVRQETGVSFPRAVIAAPSSTGPVRVLVRETQVARCELRSGKRLALAPEHVLAKRGIVGEGVEHPADGTPATWVDERDVRSVETDSTRVLAHEAIACAVAEDALRRSAAQIVGIQETQTMLDTMEGTHPALVRAIVPKPVSVAFVAEVLRSLLEEGVWIRDLRGVLEGIALHAGGDKDAVRVAEGVRESLSRQITGRVAVDGVLRAHALSAEATAAVRDGVVAGSMKAFARVDPEVARELRQHAREQCGVARAVVIADGDVRKHIWRLLAPELPRVMVLAHGEIAAGVRVEIVGVIGPVG